MRENVVCLDVSMNDFVGLEILKYNKSTQNLFKNSNRILL